MKKLLFLLGMLLLGGHAYASEEYEFAVLGPVWKEKVVNVYSNLEGFPGWFSSPNPYFQPEYPSLIPFETEEERTEYRMQVFEFIMMQRIASINEIKDSSLRVNYKGRTTRSCDDLEDGIVVVCWADESHSWVTAKTRGQVHHRQDGHGSYTDAAIYLRATVPGPGGEYGYPESTAGGLVLHELLHVAGLDHPVGKNDALISLGGSVLKVLQPYDEAAIAYLYPFSTDCEVRMSPDLLMEVPYIWVGDDMYKAGFKVVELNGEYALELLHAEIQEDPVSECGFKFSEKTNTMHIPYVRYDSLIEEERGRYFFNLNLKPSIPSELSSPATHLFEIVSYGVLP